ncbi:NCS2 family permease [Galactobacillus timonensis]|uniref:NCS2 family permease n=4 Tax=Galactobacillus timonensis TaxID=2041840 RepID=UPI002409D5D4|nr:NCS2 family permease [Galactobacillus timonensis]MDD6680147.1 NCS2 family permease [Galactobacillus timonensis]
MSKLADFFHFSDRGTSMKVELIAGLTTFMTMAYVLIVQPSAMVGTEAALTDASGLVLTKQSFVVVVSLISGLITILMGLYSNMPFALSTGMGSNFLLGGMIQAGTITFSQAMGIILVEGVIFLVLSILGVRDLIVRIIPKNIKISISTAIGFFIAYLGFKNTGLATFNGGLGMGDFKSPAVILALIGLAIIALLTAYKVKGAILIGIIVTTIIGIPMGVTTVPSTFAALPDFTEVGNVVMKLDVTHIWTAEGIVLIFIAFFGDFFSTLGTVLGLGQRCGWLDENGNLPGIEKPFLIDAIGTCVGAIFGCTTVTTYVESSAGVEAGGRTGLTAVTTGILFLIAMFFAPAVLMIPDAATGPALIFVGFIMVKGFKDIDFSDFTEAFGPFVMIMFTVFMGSMATGIAAGILAHVFIKVCTGHAKEIHPAMYILCIPLALYFVM